MAYTIIAERCVNCHTCDLFCPTSAIKYGGNQAYRIDPDKCTECGSCLEHCNRQAIVDPNEPESAVKPHGPITLDCDLCVIGSGPGLAAAVRVAQSGKNVVVLEKGRTAGGCGWYASGLFARGSKAHLATGAQDNRPEAVKEAVEKTKNKVDPALIEKAIYSSGPFYDWLMEFEDLQGRFEFRSGSGPLALEGAVGCIGLPPGARYGVGRFIQNALREACKKLGVTLLTQHRAVEIETENGAVTAVLAEDPGGKTRITCKACHLATGSFAASRDMIKEYDPLFGDMRIGRNAHGLPELTGDGVALAQKAGAYIDRDAMYFAYLLQMPSPSAPILTAHCGKDEIRISLLGKRFASESGGKMGITLPTILAQPEGVTYSISDAELWDEINREKTESSKGVSDPFRLTQEQVEDIEQFLNAPDQPLIRAESLGELANQMGVNSRVFIATVKKYNQFCEAGKDEDFGKSVENLHAIKTPPFYAIRNLVHPHGGCCGVAINANIEVKAEKGGVVPGLYASGDVVAPHLGSKEGLLHDLTWAYTGAFMASDSILEYLNKA